MSNDISYDPSGHRKRLRKRYVEHGLDNFADYEFIELLLTYCIPRKDVKPIARLLLNEFSSLAGIFEASREELLNVRGVGESAAAFLKLVPQASKRYLVSKSKPGDILKDSDEAGNFLIPYYLCETDEVIYIICMDAKHKVLACKEHSRGVVNTALINVRKLVETALTYNSANIIIAHNHISGIALPSCEDEVSTQQVKAALNTVGINLTDHIIVAYDDFVSMRDSGLI